MVMINYDEVSRRKMASHFNASSRSIFGVLVTRSQCDSPVYSVGRNPRQ